MLYSHNHNADLRTSMNERTHFFIKIYISPFILERVDVSVVCEWWMETGTDCYIDPTSSLDHSTRCCLQKPTSSASCLVLLNRRSLRATAVNLQTGPHSGLPVFNKLNCHRHLPLFFYNVHSLPPFLPLIYTGASLDWRLSQGSIYNTDLLKKSPSATSCSQLVLFLGKNMSYTEDLKSHMGVHRGSVNGKDNESGKWPFSAKWAPLYIYMSAGFRFQHEEFHASSNTEVLWYNKTVCLTLAGNFPVTT